MMRRFHTGWASHPPRPAQLPQRLFPTPLVDSSLFTTVGAFRYIETAAGSGKKKRTKRKKDKDLRPVADIFDLSMAGEQKEHTEFSTPPTNPEVKNFISPPRDTSMRDGTRSSQKKQQQQDSNKSVGGDTAAILVDSKNKLGLKRSKEEVKAMVAALTKNSPFSAYAAKQEEDWAEKGRSIALMMKAFELSGGPSFPKPKKTKPPVSRKSSRQEELNDDARHESRGRGRPPKVSSPLAQHFIAEGEADEGGRVLTEDVPGEAEGGQQDDRERDTPKVTISLRALEESEGELSLDELIYKMAEEDQHTKSPYQPSEKKEQEGPSSSSDVSPAAFSSPLLHPSSFDPLEELSKTNPWTKEPLPEGITRSHLLDKEEKDALINLVDRAIGALQRNFIARPFIHIDMDAFYCQVEQRDRPELVDVPFAVGPPSGGVVTSSNYIAREYGVKSAMPGWIAKRLCPDLKFVWPKNGLTKYQQVSKVVTEQVVSKYDPYYTSLGLDEMTMDLTNYYIQLYEEHDKIHFHNQKILEEEAKETAKKKKEKSSKKRNKKGDQNSTTSTAVSSSSSQRTKLLPLPTIPSWSELAEQIRQEILSLTRCSCSAGIAANSALAKMVAGTNKPNGQYELKARTAWEMQEVMFDLPLRKVIGVGPAQEATFAAAGIHTVKDFYDNRYALCHALPPKTYEHLVQAAAGVPGRLAISGFLPPGQRRNLSGAAAAVRAAQTAEALKRVTAAPNRRDDPPTLQMATTTTLPDSAAGTDQIIRDGSSSTAQADELVPFSFEQLTDTKVLFSEEPEDGHGDDGSNEAVSNNSNNNNKRSGSYAAPVDQSSNQLAQRHHHDDSQFDHSDVSGIPFTMFGKPQVTVSKRSGLIKGAGTRGVGRSRTLGKQESLQQFLWSFHKQVLNNALEAFQDLVKTLEEEEKNAGRGQQQQFLCNGIGFHVQTHTLGGKSVSKAFTEEPTLDVRRLKDRAIALFDEHAKPYWSDVRNIGVRFELAPYHIPAAPMMKATTTPGGATISGSGDDSFGYQNEDDLVEDDMMVAMKSQEASGIHPRSARCFRAEAIKVFEDMRTLNRRVRNDTFRAAAYQKAIDCLEAFPKPLRLRPVSSGEGKKKKRASDRRTHSSASATTNWHKDSSSKPKALSSSYSHLELEHEVPGIDSQRMRDRLKEICATGGHLQERDELSALLRDVNEELSTTGRSGQDSPVASGSTKKKNKDSTRIIGNVEVDTVALEAAKRKWKILKNYDSSADEAMALMRMGEVSNYPEELLAAKRQEVKAGGGFDPLLGQQFYSHSSPATGQRTALGRSTSGRRIFSPSQLDLRGRGGAGERSRYSSSSSSTAGAAVDVGGNDVHASVSETVHDTLQGQRPFSDVRDWVVGTPQTVAPLRRLRGTEDIDSDWLTTTTSGGSSSPHDDDRATLPTLPVSEGKSLPPSPEDEGGSETVTDF